MEERFDSWRDLIARSRDCEAVSAHADDFSAEMRRLELGPVTFLRTSFPPTLFRRTAGMVRRSDPEMYHLTLLLGGGTAMARDAGRTETYRPGDLQVIGSSAALLSELLLGLGRQADALGPAETPRLGAVVVDLVATWHNLAIGGLKLSGATNIAAASAVTPTTHDAQSPSSASHDHKTDIKRLCRSLGKHPTPSNRTPRQNHRDDQSGISPVDSN